MDKPTFVAYVYAAWHESPYRDLDEWRLLNNFAPYFAGHLPPDRPLFGIYNDTDQSTVLLQMRTAHRHGVTAFSYFLYFDARGLVFSEGLETAFALPNHCLHLAVTWCLRLPHRELPIPPRTITSTRSRLKSLFVASDNSTPHYDSYPAQQHDDPTPSTDLERLLRSARPLEEIETILFMHPLKPRMRVK